MKNDPTLRTSDYYRHLHQNPVGCGPFKFVSWSDDEIALERWEDYTPVKPHFKKLVIRWVAGAKEKLHAFLNGGLDLFLLTNEQYRKDIYSDDFTRIGAPGQWLSSNFYYIQWNCGDAGRPFFRDPQVRRAMTFALDLDRVIVQATNNLAAGRLCYGPWPFTSQFFDHKVRLLKYDLEESNKVLNDAGWTVQTDGLMGKVLATGEWTTPFQFTMLVYANSHQSIQIAHILKENLQKIGVQVDVEKVEAREYMSRLKQGDFDAYIGQYQTTVDPDLWRSVYATGGRQNYGHYSNPKIDDLFKQGARLLDPAKRAACYQEMHRILYDDQPMTFLFHPPALWAKNKRLHGVEFSIRGPYFFDPGIRNWWIPKADETGERL